MTFYDCLMECAKNKELVKEFDRLNNSNLSFAGSPINILVDEATGKQKDDLRDFIDFCYEYVWLYCAIPKNYLAIPKNPLDKNM